MGILQQRRPLGRTGFQATRLGIGDLADRTGSLLPHLSVADCLHYTLTVDPDVALLGLSFPNEQDAAFAAADSFQPLTAGQIEDVRRRAEEAIRGKGACWWNPGPTASPA